MTLVCLLALLTHVLMKPFKENSGNIAGLASAVGLLLLAILNLTRAVFTSSPHKVLGPPKSTLYFFEHVENVLLLWTPLAGLCIIFVVFLIQIGLNMFIYLSTKIHHQLIYMNVLATK